MARVKLSEYRAKKLIFTTLGMIYGGIGINLSLDSWQKQLNELNDDTKYVSKVDQAVKKRNKLGLVMVGRTKAQAIEDLLSFKAQGYRYALVEPFVTHREKDEHYIALQREEGGLVLNYSKRGGVDIENNTDSLERATFSEEGFEAGSNTTSAPTALVEKLYDIFQNAHMTYLEINPCVIRGGSYIPLDAAAEVDGSAQFFVKGAWTEDDIRIHKTAINQAEKAVEALASKSPASLSLKVLNPNGSIFLLLSGGGASVVVADEISNLGHHADIANYGEYSGNPNEEETYLYTKQVLKLLTASSAPKKVLLIAGGVANFTDVTKTFKGLIRAIADVQKDLLEQKVAVLVRRGGPNQQKGLADMKHFLGTAGIANDVYGPDISLAGAVVESLQRIAK